MFYSFYVGVGMVFNVIWVFDLNLYFYVYLLYWLLMFTETTLMITLWYIWTDSLGFWYHNAAIVGVIGFCVLSLAIKTAHKTFSLSKNTILKIHVHEAKRSFFEKLEFEYIFLHCKYKT